MSLLFKALRGRLSGALMHWLSQRLTAIVILPGFFFFIGAFMYLTYWFKFSVYNLTSLYVMFLASAGNLVSEPFVGYKIYFFVLFGLTFMHLVEGAQSIVDDYVHEECTKSLINVIFKVIFFFLIKMLWMWTFME